MANTTKSEENNASRSFKKLEVKSLTKNFKGVQAIRNLDFCVYPKEILGVIGPNGAGKTTLFNLLTGNTHPTSGEIIFNEKEITMLSPDSIANLGIARTFQNIRLFKSLSVLENVLIGLQVNYKEDILETLLSSSSFTRKEREMQDEAFELLNLFNLKRFAYSTASNLPYGDQRRLEIVRALALKPKLLLLDEPVAGMTSFERTEILELTKQIHKSYDLTIILVEHNMPLVMQLCHRILVLNHGELIADGSPSDIRKNPSVIEAYLGKVETNA